MPIPYYQSFMKPLLQYIADGREYSIREIVEHLRDHFQLSAEERSMMLKSGNARIADSRIYWARTYLKNAGLVDIPRRGYSRITERGQNLLKQENIIINNQTLKQFPEFTSFLNRSAAKKDSCSNTDTTTDDEKTPTEELELAFGRLTKEVEDELLEKISNNSPGFFEGMVIDLLVKMGYGGSRKEAGKAIGGSNDGGVDGVIHEDRLGLGKIYVQAKRWNENNGVGRPEIQKFVGALHGKHARRGIFITTSYFTQEALQYANGIESRVVLINGRMLVQLMIEYNVGVQVKEVFELKRIDHDYFDEQT